MPSVKTRGLILKQCNFNDNDRLYTIFCPEVGKISAMSKGIRSHKHKDFAAMQPFSYNDFVFESKTGLYYVSSAQIIENFYDLRQAPEKVAFASYVCDLVSILSEEIMYDEEFFKFVLNLLFVTSRSGKNEDKSDINTEIIRLKTILEMKAVCSGGYMPDFSACSQCGSKTDVEWFDVYGGAVLCKNCAEEEANDFFDAVHVNRAVLRMLKFICESDNKSVFSFEASDENIRLANAVSEKYLVNKFDIVSEKLEYMKSLMRL